LKDGVIIGSTYNNEDTPPSESGWVKKFSDGTILSYDKAAHKFTADIKGDADVKCSGKIDIDATGTAKIKASSLTIDCDVTVNGKIQATDVKAGIIDLKTHIHTGVQPGSGVSGLPQ
jgi:phage baseplate assembly protein V